MSEYQATPEFTGALEDALMALRRHVKASVARKGMPSWSPHTALGVVTEEYDEFKEAVRENDGTNQANELLDIANAALLGWMCNRAQMRLGALKTDAEA